MKPYLIQRAKFHDECTYDPTRKGIDSMLCFDYMGSAGFEFGALSESLNRIRERIADYHLFKYLLNDKKINIFCKEKEGAEIYVILTELSYNKFRLKEYCDFGDWINSKKSSYGSDFWWDIKNDFMFWKLNPEFTDKFKKLIKGENKNG